MKKMWFFVVVIVLMAGCGNGSNEPKEIPPELTSLVGTKWKFVGFFDVEKNELAEAEPKDCEECYVLEFVTNEKAEGYTSTGEPISIELPNLGKYDISDIIRLPEDEKFVRALYAQNTTSYSIISDELKFINQIEKYYLLFKRQ